MQHTDLAPGLRTSRLAYGAMTFGTEDFMGLDLHTDDKEADRLVGLAMDHGVDLFDTANMYSGGRSEELLGKAIGDRRSDVHIATKVGLPVEGTDDLYQSILDACEGSLKRLGTDYVDLYQAHFFDLSIPFEEVVRALDDLKRRGLARHVGYTNLPAWQAQRLVDLQRSQDLAPVGTAQVYYSLVGRDAEQDVLPFTQQAGVGTLVWSPLAGGFLTGKYTRDSPEGGGRQDDLDLPPVDRDRGYDVVDRLIEVANGKGATPAQVALAWLLHQDPVDVVIVGAQTAEHLEENLGAADLSLSADEIDALDEVSATAPLYPHWLYEGEGHDDDD